MGALLSWGVWFCVLFERDEVDRSWLRHVDRMMMCLRPSSSTASLRGERVDITLNEQTYLHTSSLLDDEQENFTPSMIMSP